MCTQACSGTRYNTRKFQYTEELHTSATSEDWKDSDDDDYEDFKFARKRRGTTMPDELRQILDDAAKMTKRSQSAHVPRSRKRSIHKETKDWHRSSKVNQEGELQAERYCKLVTDDTWKQLRNTLRTAGSIVDKGNAINDELARQELVLSTAANDIAFAEYEIDQATEKLKGMKSLKGKVSSMVWKKQPKLRVDEFREDADSFCNVDLSLLDEDVGLCTFSKMRESKASSVSNDISEDTEGTQVLMKAGIGQLHKTLDAITVQQMNTALALDQQDGRLSIFENRMSTTQQKINCQTQMINGIMGH